MLKEFKNYRLCRMNRILAGEDVKDEIYQICKATYRTKNIPENFIRNIVVLAMYPGSLKCEEYSTLKTQWKLPELVNKKA